MDNMHDLNVYTDTKEDGTKNPCCGNGTDKPCCEMTPSCCSNEKPAGSEELKASIPNPMDIDFNELAGKYRLSRAFLIRELLKM